MSDVVLSTHTEAQELPLSNSPALRNLVPTAPTVARRFRAGNTLTAFAAVYTDGGRGRDDLSVSETIARENEVILRREARLFTGLRAPVATHPFQVDLDLRTLTPGTYVITFEGRLSGRRTPITRQVPFIVE